MNSLKNCNSHKLLNIFSCCLDLKVYCYWLSSLTQVPRETNYSNPKSMQNGFERLLSMVRNVLFSPILVSLITTHNMLKWNSFKFENLANNWLQRRIGLYHLESYGRGSRSVIFPTFQTCQTIKTVAYVDECLKKEISKL